MSGSYLTNQFMFWAHTSYFSIYILKLNIYILQFFIFDNSTNNISIFNLRWMVQAMHGKNFSKRKWRQFLAKRAVPGQAVAFAEIEVLLCNVKSSLDVMQDRDEEERERQGENWLSCWLSCCL